MASECSERSEHRPLGPPEALSIAMRDSHPLKALTTRSCRLLFVILFKAANGFVRRLFLRRAVRLECPAQVLLAAVVVQLLELDPARVNEAVVILVLSKLAAGEVAQRRLRRGQLIAPLLPATSRSGSAKRMPITSLISKQYVGTTASSPPPSAMRFSRSAVAAFWHL